MALEEDSVEADFLKSITDEESFVNSPAGSRLHVDLGDLTTKAVSNGMSPLFLSQPVKKTIDEAYSSNYIVGGVSRSLTESPDRIQRHKLAAKKNVSPLLQNSSEDHVDRERGLFTKKRSRTLEFVRDHKKIDTPSAKTDNDNETLEWGKEHTGFQQRREAATSGETLLKNEVFVDHFIECLRDSTTGGTEYILNSLEDLPEKERLSTFQAMVENGDLHDVICNTLLKTDDHGVGDIQVTKQLCLFFYKTFTSDSSIERLFSLQFLPVLIWLLWTKDLRQMNDIVSCLHGLYLKESDIYNHRSYEPDGMNPSSEDGIDLLHDLFPEIRCSKSSQSNVYKKNENFSESSQGPEITITDLLFDGDDGNENIMRSKKICPFPTVHDSKLESLTHCLPLIEVAIKLYVHYVDRISDRSLQQFCAVVGKLCRPGAPMTEIDVCWVWDWDYNVVVKSLLPELILNSMLDVISFSINIPSTKEIAFWAFTNFHFYVSNNLLSSLSLRTLCLLEVDFITNGKRQPGVKRKKSTGGQISPKTGSTYTQKLRALQEKLKPNIFNRMEQTQDPGQKKETMFSFLKTVSNSVSEIYTSELQCFSEFSERNYLSQNTLKDPPTFRLNHSLSV